MSASPVSQARAVIRSWLARLPGASSHEPVERWRRHTRRHPDEAFGWSTLAAVLAGESRYAEARDACQRAIAIDESFATPWHVIAVCDAHAGRLDVAIAACEKAVALDPTFAVAWSTLASLYSQAGRDHDAAGARQKLLELTPAPGPGR